MQIHENHEECPVCKRMTLPRVRPGSLATGRACAYCHSIVDREGRLEKEGAPNARV